MRVATNRLSSVYFVAILALASLGVAPCSAQGGAQGSAEGGAQGSTAEGSAQGAAQNATQVLRIAAFGGDGILPGEALALQNLVTSYVVQLKLFRVIDDSGQELALKEAETSVQLGVAKALSPLSADYVLSAGANKIGSLLVFTVKVTKVASGEEKSVADTFASVNDLILAARRLTRSLFDASAAVSSATAGTSGLAASQAPPASQALPSSQPSKPAPSLAAVSGTWKGDKNVDRVTILPDGRGFAVLASGIRMAVRVSIEGAAVVIVQDQPGSPDFYRPALDLKSARVVAAAARPWRWVFALSQDGASLSGVKESVFVSVSDKGTVAVDNNYVRDAVWQRLYR